MKYDIRKMQNGGGFVSYTPILSMPTAAQQASARPKQTKKEATKDNSIIDEALYKELINQGGLINDVNWFVDQVTALEASGGMSGTSRSQSLRLVAEVNKLKRNKERWGTAFKQASSNGSLDEAAIGSSGELYTRDNKGKISNISISDYKKSPQKYAVLTVGDLLEARQNDPQLVNTSAPFVAAEVSLGMEVIQDHVKNVLGLIGTETTSTENHYSKSQAEKQLAQLAGKVPSEQETAGLQKLAKVINTPGEFFKLEEKTSTERTHLDKALKYLLNTMSPAAKNKLKVSAIQQGIDKPEQILINMLVAGTDHTTTSNITPEKETISSAKTAEKTTNLTNFQMFHKGVLKQNDVSFMFNDPELNVMFKGAIGAVGPLIDAKDRSIGMASLNTILQGADYSQIVDPTKVFFGDKKVDFYDLNNILYDGSNAAQVYMPTNSAGEPDYDKFKRFKDIYAVYEANKDSWTTEQSEKYFKKSGFEVQIDSVGGEKVISDRSMVKPFLVMYGYTNDGVVATEDNDLIKELDSNEEDAWMPRFETAWSTGLGKNRQVMMPDGDNFFKGIIAIPYRKESSAVVDALSGVGPIGRQSTVSDVQRNLNKSSGIPTNSFTSSSILNRKL